MNALGTLLFFIISSVTCGIAFNAGLIHPAVVFLWGGCTVYLYEWIES